MHQPSLPFGHLARWCRSRARSARALSRSGFVALARSAISCNHGGTASMASALSARICFTICLGNGFLFSSSPIVCGAA